jgi:hypothetical protein
MYGGYERGRHSREVELIDGGDGRENVGRKGRSDDFESSPDAESLARSARNACQPRERSVAIRDELFGSTYVQDKLPLSSEIDSERIDERFHRWSARHEILDPDGLMRRVDRVSFGERQGEPTLMTDSRSRWSPNRDSKCWHWRSRSEGVRLGRRAKLE